MFYCKKCANTHRWPESMTTSVGPCEVCGHRIRCFDVPSSSLPPESGEGKTQGLYNLHTAHNPLLSCPYCGNCRLEMTFGLSKGVHVPEEVPPIPDYFIVCKACGAHGPHCGDRLLAHHAWQQRANPWEILREKTYRYR